MSIDLLKKRIDFWAAEVASPDTDFDHKRTLRNWAFGVSVALSSIDGYDELVRAANDIWNPPIPENAE